MRHDILLFVLVPLYVIVVAALVIAQLPPQETKPVAVVDKNDAGPQAVGSVGGPGLSPDCEKELRRTADLLRFFANRIQTGEDTKSVVADMRQHEKKISAVCE